MVSYSCCSVAWSCPTLCNPMDCSVPGFPVLYHLLEFAQTHVHWVSDTIQPSYPLSPPPPPAVNISKHQSLFQVSWLFVPGEQESAPRISKEIEVENVWLEDQSEKNIKGLETTETYHIIGNITSVLISMLLEIKCLKCQEKLNFLTFGILRKKSLAICGITNLHHSEVTTDFK